MFCSSFLIFLLDSARRYLKRKSSENDVVPFQQPPRNNVARNANLLTTKTEIGCALLFVLVNVPLLTYRILSMNVEFFNDNQSLMDFLFYFKHLISATFVSIVLPGIVALRNQELRAFLRNLWLEKIFH